MGCNGSKSGEVQQENKNGQSSSQETKETENKHDDMKTTGKSFKGFSNQCYALFNVFFNIIMMK